MIFNKADMWKKTCFSHTFSNIHIDLFGWRFILYFLAVPASDLLMTRYIIRMKFLVKKSLAHALYRILSVCKTTSEEEMPIRVLIFRDTRAKRYRDRRFLFVL